VKKKDGEVRGKGRRSEEKESRNSPFSKSCLRSCKKIMYSDFHAPQTAGCRLVYQKIKSPSLNVRFMYSGLFIVAALPLQEFNDKINICTDIFIITVCFTMPRRYEYSFCSLMTAQH